MPSASVFDYPPELLFSICAHIYSSALPVETSSLDPLITADQSPPTSLPSTFPPSNWPEPVARRTLANLCLVNRSWYEAAKPWLWRRVEVRLPRSWLALVEQVAGDADEEVTEEQTAYVVDQTIQEAEKAVLAAKYAAGEDTSEEAKQKLHESILRTLGGPDCTIPLELLSPPASRDPSPRRPRAKSKSPVRWKLMRSISDAVLKVLGNEDQGVYVAIPEDPRPGRYVRHLDFNHFRTIGMRRSIEEGVNSRFVTGERLEAVLKEMPNLLVFGATEYMDGALTLAVLKELFLRGSPSRGRGRASRSRALTSSDADDMEEEDRERRRDCRELEAVDLTGCVSAVFVNALHEFVQTCILPPPPEVESDESESDELGRRRRNLREFPDEPLRFPGVQRLCMLGAKSIPSAILHPFVMSFPSLTHLDLSCTRVTPELLFQLSQSTTVRLRALSLGRCMRLTSESIRAFLVDTPVTKELNQLSLYGDGGFRCPLTPGDLADVLTRAPAFTSGNLVYLDLSSADMTNEMLKDVQLQPKLRSLGLSHIPHLSLDAIAAFFKEKASNVEVLTLVSTSPELGYGMNRVPPRQVSLALHVKLVRALCTPPVSFSLSAPPSPGVAPTKLRVIELAPALLASLGQGAGTWRIVKSKGGRAWYVDTASGWVTSPGSAKKGEKLLRELPKTHPLRVEMDKLADANGNVSSGVGWHARKMEVLDGHGMLGREDGLYGAVSFAYQG